MDRDSRFFGVYRGQVADNDDKTKKLGRVRVRMTSLPGKPVTDWAWLTVLMGGPERGSFFLPEKDDEVLVAFEEGDFARPYVVGAVWSDGQKPPESEPRKDDKVVKRLIKSRTGHIIRLDDTDGEEKIEIIDKTGKNLIMVDSKNNTITIHSEKDIVLDSPNGKLSITATDLEVTATNKGMVDGSKGLDVKAGGGDVNIKGNKVNIN